MKIPKRRICIVRMFYQDGFHVFANKKHRAELCGFDYREVKENVQKVWPRRKILFVRQPKQGRH